MIVIKDLCASKSYAYTKQKAGNSFLPCVLAPALIQNKKESRAANKRKRGLEAEEGEYYEILRWFGMMVWQKVAISQRQLCMDESSRFLGHKESSEHGRWFGLKVVRVQR